MEAESYADAETARFIEENFVPFTVNIKDHPGLFHRFDAVWTPTILVMSPKGVERTRIEGYVPRDEFRALLEMGLGRVAFMAKRWDDAMRWYSEVADNRAKSTSAPEALYWRAVCKYSGHGDHAALGAVADELQQKHPQSIWATKASVWKH